ncbi:AraC family transcriptional regulator [Longitalea arenae]|uniref:AraC family transcriptional regulator n=1 Tax=Longitalea arenae TaxID=2812558 RepID=UPI0019672198|nr:AraC family transcriptional regulator [Longitalea arenae]
MHIENSTNPFFVSREEVTVWTRRPHKHNFFELVFIEAGSGLQCINQNKVPYTTGNIFLLPPYDCHSFTIGDPTVFIFIRFNSLFFRKDRLHMMDYTEWFQNLHYILSSYNRQPGDIINNSSDKTMLVNLIMGIYGEYVNKGEQSESIIRAHMFTLLNIVMRNFEQSFRYGNRNFDRQANDIIQYVQYNLFDNEKLRVESIAGEFHLSPKYVGEYFKKKTGESLKEYILRSRVNVAKSRLENSEQTAKEIAIELGFTDASHMSKVIRKYDPPHSSCDSTALA